MKRAAPVLALLVLAPWVGEFLLGISIRKLLSLSHAAGMPDRDRVAAGKGAICAAAIASRRRCRDWSPTTPKPRRSALLMTTSDKAAQRRQ
jgi:hypothetical protein